ncbi:MAG TPA: TetR/AcrR family transcriptional regulator [Solirubrobacteraceae bacterium]|jgi:AcrR family transcriptional regulator|nr:TetR/AcrR family transcriptional regulator [Solirubrobacteraceae bacterium]
MPDAHTSSSRQRRGSAGRHRRTPLSRRSIVTSAITLIEREGPDALSMRRLGRRLGVEAMALYHHFTSRDELIVAIADDLLAPLDDLRPTDDWSEACRRFATALRNVAVEHPATFRLVGLQPFDSPSALRPVERLLQVLVRAGFPPARALAIYRSVVSYARGYALAEATGFTVDATRPAGRSRLATLSPGEFPVLSGRAEELTALEADDAYTLGLDAMLRGLGDDG